MRGFEDSSNDRSSSRLFCEIEALSKALDLDSKSRRRRSCAAAPSPGMRSFSSGRSLAPSNNEQKEKKPSSLWNWKPLKALSHIRHRRFDCVFSLRVNAIENLPPALADTRLSVHWRRTTSDSISVSTAPSTVIRGTARFDETLTYRCSVYGSRSRAQGSAKYEARNFLVYATVVGAPGLDLGKHRIDLTRLLPVNLDELEEGRSSGKWATVFHLSGKAIGASLSVCFGYSIASKDDKLQMNSVIFNEKLDRISRATQFGRLPVIKSQSLDEMEGQGESSGSVEKMMVTNVDDDKVFDEMKDTESWQGSVKDNEGSELIVIEDGIEMMAKEEDEEIGAGTNQKEDENSFSTQETTEPAINLFGISISELEEMGYPKMDFEVSDELQFDDFGPTRNADSTRSRSRSLDDLTEEVSSEFLSMLELENGSEGGLESPREQLWKQFKMDSSVLTDCMFGLDIESDEEISWDNSVGLFNFSETVYDSDFENHESSPTNESKSKARMLEDAETEALLREWGLDEKVFDGSPARSMDGFGSPIHLPPEEPPELPPLSENLGPFVRTKDGGFLRSMSPNLFKNSKGNGNLIMQVSKPMVMPAEMGSDNSEILHHLASIGVEKLSLQASKLLPLQEVSGGLMQQLAWESDPNVEAFHRREDDLLFDLNTSGRNGKHISISSDRNTESSDEYVSLEDLAPLAMDKIESLSIEGLKIQSGMSDEEAHLNITQQSAGEMPCSKEKVGKITSLGLRGVVGLHLLDIEDNGDAIDGLMSLSISLDEWIQLDMGIVEEKCNLSDRTSKILAAHHAKSTCENYRNGKNSEKRTGLLESNFTVALMVQLRDPLRNYEPVGTPMLALIQVERVFLPPKPKLYQTVLNESKTEEDDDDIDENDEVCDTIPRFRVTDVHVAGLKAELGKKRHWGSSIQHQSGSRWLIANGMGKHNKHALMRSNLSTKNPPEETFWSISSQIHSREPKLSEVRASKPKAWNPGFLFFR